jgi:hypothetical protein
MIEVESAHSRHIDVSDQANSSTDLGLCVTGAEALYADMGHFGKRPISRPHQTPNSLANILVVGAEVKLKAE